MARNPPACPDEKRSLGENLVNNRWIPCSAQVRLPRKPECDSISIVLKFRLGSAGEPNLCSHCYCVPYMKRPANNQVIDINLSVIDMDFLYQFNLRLHHFPVFLNVKKNRQKKQFYKS